MNLLACALTALLVGFTPGVKYMDTVVQDDGIFLHSPPAQLARSATQLKELGADALRVTAAWSVLAPGPRSSTKPGAPFDARDSATYPQDDFRRLDHAVSAATAAGLKVQIDVGFWSPRWAVAKGSANPERQRWWPSPSEYADFATAVASRYSGGFPDPEHGGQTLPAVRTFTPWNEPNHPSFLMPQWKRTPGGGWRAASPDLYRPLYLAAYHAIKTVSGANRVLLGNLAATGSDTPGRGGVPPLKFLRRLACVNDLLLPMVTRECRGYQAIPADGLAMHPYSFRFGAPDAGSPNPDDAPLADTARVGRLITALRALGRIRGSWPILDTEYGYETNPPDARATAVSPENQARFLSQATFMAWRDPDTTTFAQFELRDVDPTKGNGNPRSKSYWRDFQTGLLYADGSAKPSARAFQMPFWAQGESRAGGKILVLFGMIRPTKGRQVVRFERQDPVSGAWGAINTYGLVCTKNQPDVLTDSSGTLFTTAPWQGPGTYRMLWRRDTGAWIDSVPIQVGEPGPGGLLGVLQPPT